MSEQTLRASRQARLSLPFRRQLRWSLILYFVLLAIVPVAVVAYVVFARTTAQATEQVYQQLDTVVELKRDQVGRWLDAGNLALDTLLIGSNLDRLTALAAAATVEPQEQAALTRLLIDVTRAGYFKQVFVYDTSGRVIASSNPARVGQNVGGQPYFDVSLHADYIQAPYSESGATELVMYMTRPLRSGRIRAAGVLAGQLDIGSLADILSERTGLGESDETYLVSLENNHLLTPSRFEGYEMARAYHSEGIDHALNGETGRGAYGDYRTPPAPVFGSYRFVPELQAGLVTEIDQAEALGAFWQAQLISIGVVGIAALLAVLIGLFASQRISKPIQALTASAQRIGAGDLTAEVVEVQREDEIGVLSQVFHRTWTELRTLYQSLEQQVAARTAQLHASSDVGRAAASILDADRLMRAVVNLITDRFGFYYAALFALDEVGQYAVLREATGPQEVGRILKERGHRLEVGGNSMVGYVTANKKPRIALDVGEEAVRFANPLLPDTRSEVALPLVVGDRILGALDVQSTQGAAFDDASVAVLQSMADQVAVALANARSFESVQAALQSTTRLYDLSRTLFAAASPREAYLAVGQVLGNALPEVDTFSIVLIAARDVQGHPLEYEQVAHWDVMDGVKVDQPGRCSPADVPLLSLAQSDAPVFVSASDATLPESTRHILEAAAVQLAVVVPLLIRGRFEGMLLIKGQPPAGLTEGDIHLIQVVAEQLSVVLGSLRASEETQAALARVELLNRQLSGEAWRTYLAAQSGGLTVESGQSVAQLSASRVAAPIVVRGETLGTLTLEDADTDRQWTEEEWALVNSVAGEVAQAVENARLIEQTQRRAAREAQLNEIAQKIRRASDMDSILRVAAEELSRTLDTSHASARLGTPATLAGRRNGG